MRLATIVLFCLVLSNAAEAKLSGGSDISFVAMDLHDPNLIYLRLQFSTCKAAISTNGGVTFQSLDERNIPSDLSTNLDMGTRRYVVADAVRLFRSDDSGVTWTNTGASSFIRDQCEIEMEREKKMFREDYGHRLPSQSPFWIPIFCLYAGVYFLLTFFALRVHGWASALWTGLRGLALILLVWCFLWSFHGVIKHLTDSQYPLAYWNTSAQHNPSLKLGLAMAIAARPLPLLIYLLALWPLLPGSFLTMTGCRSSPSQNRFRAALGLSIIVGVGFVAFHLYMLFAGYFWE